MEEEEEDQSVYRRRQTCVLHARSLSEWGSVVPLLKAVFFIMHQLLDRRPSPNGNRCDLGRNGGLLILGSFVDFYQLVDDSRRPTFFFLHMAGRLLIWREI